MSKDKKFMEYVKCECSYNNNPERLKLYGTCLRCGKVLDKQVKFRHEMMTKLNFYRKGRNKNVKTNI